MMDDDNIVDTPVVPVADDTKKPWWLEWASVFVCMSLALMVGGFGVYAVAAARNNTVINERMSRLFEKTDQLPLMQAQLSKAITDLQDARGSYNSIDARLRMERSINGRCK